MIQKEYAIIISHGSSLTLVKCNFMNECLPTISQHIYNSLLMARAASYHLSCSSPQVQLELLVLLEQCLHVVLQF